MRFVAIVSVLFAAAASVFASPVVERGTTQSAATILANLHDQVRPLAHQLQYATPENATEANLKPIINQMSTSVTNAVVNLKRLSGGPTDVILASPDGTDALGPSDIAGLLGCIINLIFQAVEALLHVVDSKIHSIICDLLIELGQLVCSLISVLLTLVADLLPPLLVLLAPILSIVSLLGLTDILRAALGGAL